MTVAGKTISRGEIVTIDGAMVENNIEFADSTGRLTIDNLAQFDAVGSNNTISGFTAGDRIDLAKGPAAALDHRGEYRTRKPAAHDARPQPGRRIDQPWPGRAHRPHPDQAISRRSPRRGGS